METFYILCGPLVVLVIIIALGLKLIHVSRPLPPPPPPSKLGVCSPSDSPYAPTFLQQGSYRQPLHAQPPPLQHLATPCPETSSRYSTVQAPSSSQPSPYQPHRLSSIQYPPLATPPLLSRDALVPEPVCYPPQPSRPPARAPQVPVVPIAIEPQATPPVLPDVALVIEPGRSFVPQRLHHFSRPELATGTPEVVPTPIVIDLYKDTDSPRSKARNEGDRMKDCFKQSCEAFDRNERGDAKQLSVNDQEYNNEANTDQNQADQENEHYTSLRAKAKKEGDAMAECFRQSHEAYSRREGALAKELSEKGKKHKCTMEALNAEASAWIFRENNSDRKPGELDLHGLYVKEAISYSDKAIKEAQQRGDSQIRFITGKGLHSNDRVGKIKPALEDLVKQLNLSVEVDPQNAGVLIVQLA
ncbi:hypothetical protein BDR07DRAFT_69275 [Suillus spraguei]|nr:hypothetical protein BDR07DRAFT_69275 [Suillus spraguei]